MNERAMRSYTFISMSESSRGGTPVGIMAWWSVTFDESNTFLLFFRGLPPRGLTRSAYGAWPEKDVLKRPFIV